MPSYTLVEPCCGGAALTLHLLGAHRALLPYQGSKWRFRHALAEQAAALGFSGPPHRVILTDPGPWGITMGVVLQRRTRIALADALEAMALRDPREIFDSLHGALVPQDPVRFAAQYLFLQRLAFSGKAVGSASGRWSSPGFNISSAYGIPATDRFGEVKPMIPSLVRVLRDYATLEDVDVRASAAPAVHPVEAVSGPTLVYIDPPWAKSTAYPDGTMTPYEVVALATAWKEAGAAVMVSEQCAIPLPTWPRERLHVGRKDTSPFRGKQEQWITCSPQRRRRAA